MTGANFLQLILVVLILVAVGIPLFSKLPPRRLFAPLDPVEEEYKHLLVRKEEVLLAIKELEFDFKTDKISKTGFRCTPPQVGGRGDGSPGKNRRVGKAVEAEEKDRECGLIYR